MKRTNNNRMTLLLLLLLVVLLSYSAPYLMEMYDKKPEENLRTNNQSIINTNQKNETKNLDSESETGVLTEITDEDKIAEVEEPPKPQKEKLPKEEVVAIEEVTSEEVNPIVVPETTEEPVSHQPGDLIIYGDDSGGARTITCRDCDHVVGRSYGAVFDSRDEGVACIYYIINGEFYCFLDGDFYPITSDEEGNAWARGMLIARYNGISWDFETGLVIYGYSDMIGFPDDPMGFLSDGGPRHDSDEWKNAEAIIRSR